MPRPPVDKRLQNIKKGIVEIKEKLYEIESYTTKESGHDSGEDLK